MLDTPQVVQSPAQQIATIHLTVPREQVPHVMGPGLRELMTTIVSQGAVIAGAWLVHHLRHPGPTFDFEIAIPVQSPVTPAGRVRPGELRATRVVRAVYEGPYEGLGIAWGAFNAWIGEQGFAAAEDIWEVYLDGPETGRPPSTYRTQLNQPLAD